MACRTRPNSAISGIPAYNLWRWLNATRFDLPGKMIAQRVAATVLLLFIAAALGWGGVGMLRRRRWVLPAGQAMSSFALAVGLVVLEMSMAELAINEELTPGGTDEAVGMVIGIALLFLVGVVLPASYLVLFLGENVRRTLEHDDPYPVWTDRFPRPVLVVGLGSFYLGLLTMTWVGNARLPCFGRYATGWGTIAMAMTWAVLLLATSAACASRRRIGWWLAISFCILFSASLILTFWQADPRAIYGAADLKYLESRTYVDTKLKQWPLHRINDTILCLICAATAVVYLLRTRAAFQHPPAASPKDLPPPPAPIE